MLVVVVDGSRPGWSSDVTEIITWGSQTSLILLNKSDEGVVADDKQHTLGIFLEKTLCLLAQKMDQG